LAQVVIAESALVNCVVSEQSTQSAPDPVSREIFNYIWVAAAARTSLIGVADIPKRLRSWIQF
jgi:hypothetical protein